MHASIKIRSPGSPEVCAGVTRRGRPVCQSTKGSQSTDLWKPSPMSLSRDVAMRIRSMYTRRWICAAGLTRGQVFASAVITDQDRSYMRQAIAMAERGLGQTDPNPAVGCVIVKDGEVVGEGFHPKAGMPHAEVYALRGAGNAAKGATAYVTLEPCNHFGRTPPCSRALVDAGVSKVVVGVVDPNPLVGGEGVKTLEAAGIEVVLIRGSEEERCYEMNKDFMQKMENSA